MKTKVKLYANPKDEHQHQVNVIRWSMTVRDRYPELALLHAVPNGGLRDPVNGTRLKDEGVKAGVPDLDLPVPRGQYHGLRIEIKLPNAKPSAVRDDQRWWIERLTEQGYAALICRGWEQARDVIVEYMEGRL